jgi:hypothetical protein
MVSLVGKVREACERAGAARCGRLLAEAHALIVGEANASIDVVDGHPTSGCVAVCGRLVLGEQPPNVSGLSSIDEFVSKCRDETRTAGYRLPNCRIRYASEDGCF